MLVDVNHVVNYINNFKYCNFHLTIFSHYLFLSKKKRSLFLFNSEIHDKNTRFNPNLHLPSTNLTHWGRVTQICVFTLQLCKTDDAKSAFLTRAYFLCTIHLIMQYIEPVSEWFCWRMFIETWPHSELTFRHRASSI